MSLTDDFKAIVTRLRGWGFDVVEYSGCYGRSNGSSWRSGKPDGHVNHHYVCSMNPAQSYIDSLVANLANGKTVNWFTDVNGRAYLLGTGPMNHAGTGNSSVLSRTQKDQPNYAVASSAGDMSGNQNYSGTEAQHPGDATPWPDSLLQITFAINAAEFLQWKYTANRAINHFAWTNRKIDMSWMNGVNSGPTQGQALVQNVQRYMDGGKPPVGGAGTPQPPKEWTDTVDEKEFIAAMVKALDSSGGQAALTKAVDARLVAQLGKGAVTNPNSVLMQGVSARIGADRRADLASGITVVKK